jgi:dynein light intermediate chain 2
LLALLQSAGGLSGKDDKPKPTVALEYMFARRTGSANGAKDVAHIWELGASVMRGSATPGGRCVTRRLGSRTL